MHTAFRFVVETGLQNGPDYQAVDIQFSCAGSPVPDCMLVMMQRKGMRLQVRV